MAVPISPDSSPGSPSLGVSARSTPRSARRHAAALPRSRSFERTGARQMLNTSNTVSPLRSPSPMASPPTPRYGLTFGPDASASPATVRKAEGQLRLDVRSIAQHTRRQLVRVQQLLPVAEETAAQALAATQIAASAIRANPTLKSAGTTAAAMQRDAVRHALRQLANVGDSSTFSMEQRVGELRHCEAHLTHSLGELEGFEPSDGRAGEHSSLAPGTLSSGMSFPHNNDTVTSMVAHSLDGGHEHVRRSMAEAVHTAQDNVFNAKEVCRYAMEQLRVVRSELTTSRGQVQVAQAKMAAERLSRSRADPRTMSSVSTSVSPRRAPPRTDSPSSEHRPVTGDLPRWPQSSAAPQRQGFRRM